MSAAQAPTLRQLHTSATKQINEAVRHMQQALTCESIAHSGADHLLRVGRAFLEEFDALAVVDAGGTQSHGTQCKRQTHARVVMLPCNK